MTERGAASGPTIGIADDHPIVRAALASALGVLGEGVRILEAADGAATLALVDTHPELDLLLMDLHMPLVEGISGVRNVRNRAPALPVVVISAEEQPDVVASLIGLGVSGYIPKSDHPAVIVSAVRLVLAGGIYVPPRFMARGLAAGNGGTTADGSQASLMGLTPRQQDVLRLLGEGKSNKVIARELGITEGTVKVHLIAVFRAFDVRNRTAAVVAAQRLLSG